MANFDLTVLLVAKDMASKTIGKVSKQISGLDKAGRTASRGLSNLGANLAKIGAVAAVGIGVAVKSGIASLAELESAVTSVDGAIAQMGLTGQFTGAQIATWANTIEANVGAAFDDKAITQATATLIRFGKVTPTNLQPAMQVMTDLATKTGSVESAATLLAKALADPEKAAGKLSRQGVILTKTQQAEIKAFMAAGKAAEAQKVILDALTATTKGAALASQGPYKRAMSVLADVTEDAQRALAEGFLPVLERLSAKLGTAMSDPKFIAGIREFGQGLAKGLDSLISIAEQLPWGTIGTSLQIAGAGARTVLEVFTKMPPWVQTAVLTGWGLNKLTGGALGSLVGQLASGLIKGVLGITAGVVHLKAATVVGAPGVGGSIPTAVGGGLMAGAAGTLIAATSVTAIGAAVALAMYQVIPRFVNGGRPALPGAGPGGQQTWQTPAGTIGAMQVSQFVGLMPSWVKLAAQAGGKPVTQTGGRGDQATADEVKRLGTRMGEMDGVIERAVAKGMTPTRADVVATMEKNVRATQSGDDRNAARLSSMTAAANATTAAINAKDYSVTFKPTLNVFSTVSVRGLNVAQTVRSSYSGIMVNRPRGTGPLP